MKKKIILALLILTISGFFTAAYLFNMPHKKVEHTKGIAITAEQLGKEYGANEKDANTKYLNKAIEVSGTIMEADKNQDGGTMLVLQTGDAEKGVQCAMREKGNGNYTKGQSVVIKGFCSDYGITGVSLTDCVIK